MNFKKIILPAFIVLTSALSVFLFKGFVADLYSSSYLYFCHVLIVFLFGSFLFSFKHVSFEKLKVLAVATIAVSILYTAYKPRMRMLSDDAHYINVSKNIFENNKVEVGTGQIFINNKKVYMGGTLHGVVDFYAYMLSYVHKMFGYKWENVFKLNYIISIGILFLIFLVAFNLSQKRSVGFLATAIFASNPICLRLMSSSSSDLLFVFAFLWCACLSVKKVSLSRNVVLIIALSLLAQTRYEGAFIATLLFLLIIFKERAFFSINILQLSAMLALFIVFLLPSASVYLYKLGAPNPRLLPFAAQAEVNVGRAAFSASNIYYNFLSYFSSELWINFYIPSILIVFLLSLKKIASELKLFLKRNYQFIIAGLVHFMIIAFYIFGKASEESSARLYVLSLAVLSIVISKILTFKYFKLTVIKSCFLSLALLVIAVVIMPLKNDESKNYRVNKFYYLKDKILESPRSLFVLENISDYAILDKSTIHIKSFVENKDKALSLLRGGLIDNIFIVRDLQNNSRLLSSQHPDLKLDKSLESLQNNGPLTYESKDYYTVIYKVNI